MQFFFSVSDITQIGRTKSYTRALLSISTMQPFLNNARVKAGTILPKVDPWLSVVGGRFLFCCSELIIGFIGNSPEKRKDHVSYRKTVLSSADEVFYN